METNEIAMGVVNFCSYTDLAMQSINNVVIEAQKTNFQRNFYFVQYRDD